MTQLKPTVGLSEQWDLQLEGWKNGWHDWMDERQSGSVITLLKVQTEAVTKKGQKGHYIYLNCEHKNA